MKSSNVYITFENNCREAMTFYQEVLGGKLSLMVVGDTPMKDQCGPGMNDKILHSSLSIGNSEVMASDMRMGPVHDGNSMTICITCESEDELRRFQKELAAGGKVDHDVMQMYDGALIGSITDKYNKKWMFYYHS